MRAARFAAELVASTLLIGIPEAASSEEPRDPPKMLPGGFGLRTKERRQKAVEEGGGSKESEAAVAKGLRWLALHQAPEGFWSLDQFNKYARTDLKSKDYLEDNLTGKGQKNDSAGAAFGVLPFLAAGVTHRPTGREADDTYAPTVRNAIDYLLKKQGKEGNFPGGMYAHALGTMAVCEAYGMTADPILKKPAQLALDYIVAAQDPASGGWRYSPRSGGDTSVTGWQVQALKAGQVAGLTVPRKTLDLASKWLDFVVADSGFGFGYTGPGEAPTTSAVGLLCRQYLGTPPRNPHLRNGVDRLMKNHPPGSQRNIYGEYYATHMFHNMGGDYWDFWNRKMRDTLIGRQEKDGSWDPKGDAHSGAGGRIMQTSLSLLTLEVYYSHAPLYQRVEGPEK